MTDITRRQSLQLLLGAAACAAASTHAFGVAEPSLDSLARRTGRRFGTAVGQGQPGSNAGPFADPGYRRIIEADCGILVAENEMKWQWLRPTPDTFDFSGFDRLVDYAKAHSMAVRGHTLLWHKSKWMPDWEATHDFGANPVQAAEAMLTNHITTICKRYGDAIVSYDVVNEAVHDADGVLEETALSKALGGAEATIDLAFHMAREHAPHAELVYNDYMGWEAGNDAHRTGVLKLLEGLRKRNVPVDTLGLQSHLIVNSLDPETGIGRREEEAWQAFVDEAVGMGYRLVITEFDVQDKALPTDIAARDAGVSAYARAYLDMMLNYKEMGDVLAWGLSDRYSWLQGFSPRDDGTPVRGCPYGHDFKAKPLHEAIAASLRAATPRS
ncbi:endo-1,4-beta-xylanase [Gimibacter soli]|uniref:Beta-xylanase n=1 Tax=Gimibacter soli TaxID=3024400 RepID=A0AAF0BMZ6_9PROT|nr:endo-1,4-beta-xylanase [Gimibacter soli]WCL55290.1 endo-1,4-beta-xylanase [Gimibacter soli]